MNKDFEYAVYCSIDKDNSETMEIEIIKNEENSYKEKIKIPVKVAKLLVRLIPDCIEKSENGRPEFITDEHLEYLDELRESGITNMYGATPFLMKMFLVDRGLASKILSYWMKTFSERHPRE